MLFNRIVSRGCLLAAVFVMFVGAGCASQPQGTNPAMLSSAPVHEPCKHAECLVCKMNADLACVDVELDKQTPSAVHQGKTYYFCSDECHERFVKNPQKYVQK